MKTLTVLKLGGELLEDEQAVRGAAEAIARLARRGPLAVVHGGGRAIDAELSVRGLRPRVVDGLRVTDSQALDAVVCVLAGRTNTALVAALGALGGRAVGLTGVDAGIGVASLAPAFRSVAGESVDLGRVGQPDGTEATLVSDLVRLGYIPIIACVGVDRTGALLNVNGDALAAHLAAVLDAGQLLVAGGTPGVLDADDRTIPALTLEGIDVLTSSGAAHSGMVAKLAACRHAVERGVADVAIVRGRNVADFATADGTRIVA